MLYSVLDSKDYVSYIKSKYIWVEDMPSRSTLIIGLDNKILYSEGYSWSKVILLSEYVFCNRLLFEKYSYMEFKDSFIPKSVISMSGFYIAIARDNYPFIGYIVYWCGNKVLFNILSDGTISTDYKLPTSIVDIITSNIKYLEYYWLSSFGHILYKDRGVENVRVCGIT